MAGGACGQHRGGIFVLGSDAGGEPAGRAAQERLVVLHVPGLLDGRWSPVCRIKKK